MLANHTLRHLLKAAALPRSTWYWWQSRKPGRNDDALCEAIRQVALQHKRRYGYRRITAHLHNQGLQVNHKKVNRLMVQADLSAKVRRVKYSSWKGESAQGTLPDLLQRNFTAPHPGEKFVTDVTEFKVGDKKLYLSPIMDLYNREIVAVNITERPTYALAEDMLDAFLRTGRAKEGAILHSDQGWHYQMAPWRHRVKESGMVGSMSRKGNCLDNAVIESFFAVLKTEMYHEKKFGSTQELAEEIMNYIRYYNHDRIKIGLGGKSPVEYRTHQFPNL